MKGRPKPTERRRGPEGLVSASSAKMASVLASVSILLAALPWTSQAHTAPSELSLFQPPAIALDPDITVQVGPTLLFESGEWVTVSWTGIESWMFPDAFVAAFSPGTALDNPATITDVAPIKYQFLTAGKPFPGGGAEAKNAAGVGGGELEVAMSLRFRLLNLRDAEGYRFGLFKGGVENPVLVASTQEAVTFAQPFEVLHVHLALTSEPDSMRVSWVTGDASQAPTVRFREIAAGGGQEMSGIQGPSWQEATAETSASYGPEDMCGAPASTKGFHNPGMLHSSVLRDLTPGQAYEYQPGDSDAQEWGASSFFYAPPLSSGTAKNEQRFQPSNYPGLTVAASAEAAGEAAASKAKNSANPSNANEASSTPREPVRLGAWGPDAVKVGVFGDMGTAEVDGTFDAGHSNEPPSIRTVGILKDHLRGDSAAAARETSVRRGGGGLSGGDVGGGAEPQLGLVLHIGDLSYARGYDAQWDEYMDQIEPVASAVPWMVGVGNHERDFPTTSASAARQELSFFTGTDSGGDCGVPTAFRFIMPGEAEEPMADSPWYGFDFGPVHFTVMSTEHDFSPGSKQREFIEDDLSRVDRSKTPWVVFTGHRPMYVNSGGAGAGECEGSAALEPHCANDQPVAKALRSSLESLLVEHQVDLALYGHHHSYQRTCKVANEVCMGMSSETLSQQDSGYKAPVHVVLGMAGMGLSQNMVSPSPEWVEYATDREYGLGMIVADSSKLQLSFLLDGDGQVGDEIVLVRPSYGSSSSEANGASAETEGIGVAVDARRVEWAEIRDHVEGASGRSKEISKRLGEGRARRSKITA